MEIFPMDQNRRILIVDDNKSIHEDFRKILIERNRDNDSSNNELLDLETKIFDTPKKSNCPDFSEFQIDSAFQGEEAVETIRKARNEGRPYSVSFVDIRMPPGIDGVETTRRILSEDENIQIILCTAYSDYSWEDIIEKLGPTDRILVLKKPFDNIEVLQLVTSLTEKWTFLTKTKSEINQLTSSISAKKAELLQINSKLREQINEREQKALELDKARSELERILTAVPSVLIGVDHQGKVIHWNTWAERLFGISSAEIIGNDFLDCPIPWDWERIKNALRHGNNQDWLAGIEDIRFKQPDNKEGFLSLRACSLESKEEDQNGYLIFASDTTDRKMLEVQRIQAQKLESLGKLASCVAHEIKDPTQFVGDNLDFLSDSLENLCELIKGYKRLLAVDSEDEINGEELENLKKIHTSTYADQLLDEIPDALERSRASISRVTKIVQAMKHLSSNGKEKPTSTDINAVLEDALILSQHTWKQKATVSTHLTHDLPQIDAIAGELNQAFFNIIVNAAESVEELPEGQVGSLTISTHTVGENIEIRVEDNGPGISEEHQTAIFSPFFTTKEDPNKNKGNGLTIAQSIVKKHGGIISFESTQGKGTTFTISLPTANATCSEIIEDLQAKTAS